MKAETDWLARKRGQVGAVGPLDPLPSRFGGQRLGSGEHFTCGIQRLDAQLASLREDVHEEMTALEHYGARRESAILFECVHRGEAIATKHRQSDASAGVHAAGTARGDARISAVGEDELVIEHDADAGGGMDVAAIPVAFLAGRGDEGATIWPIPVEAIAAKAELEFRELGELAFIADFVVWAEVDLKHAEHYALIRDGAEAVELRGYADSRIGLVETVGIRPENRLRPFRTLHEVARLVIPAIASMFASLLNAVAPDVAEGIMEDGTVVARLARGHRIRPRTSITRGLQKVTFPTAIREEFKTCILRREIKPHAIVAPRVAAFREQQIVFEDAEIRTRPCFQVRTRRESQRSTPARGVEHLELLRLGIEKQTAMPEVGHGFLALFTEC